MQPDRFEVAPFPSLAALQPDDPPVKPLRVCIATEEIVGPIANGGIASTYFDLARFLTAQGHSVTVLYLKGQVCHNETIQHWVDHYASLGIRFVPLPDPEVTVESVAPNWQNRSYAMLLWLQQQPDFDVIHTSEWRGGAYYSLLAKRQGIAFRDTLFVVKTSSPHIWNRHYQMRFVESEMNFGVLYPEQVTVELADMVVGGSAHLLRFMEHMGYSLPPRGRVFVQPNVILFDRLNVEDKRPGYDVGDLVKTNELVFFGRLEQRKGLEIFCDAMDYVVARGYRPSRISFLGKQGGTRIPSHPHLATKDFIELRAENWPCEVEIHDSFNQHAAISYMLQRPCVAVMPSLIENSTMAVYEALVYRIPFIATRVGGTPELIDPAYHEDSLCEANPRDLARALERVLTHGQAVAGPAFSNEGNLDTWQRFHEFLAWSIPSFGVERTLERIATLGGGEELPRRSGERSPVSLSVCLAHVGEAALLSRALRALHALEPEPGKAQAEICLAVRHGDLVGHADLRAAVGAFQAAGGKVVETTERTLGETFNLLAAEATGDALVFLRSDVHLPHDGFAESLKEAFSHSDVAALAPAYEDGGGSEGHTRRHLPMGGDMALGFYQRHALTGDVLAVRADAFRDVGGFCELSGLGGLSQHLAMRLLAAGHSVQALPLPLYDHDHTRPRWLLDEESAQYLVSMPLIETAPLPLKKILLGTRLGGSGKPATAPKVRISSSPPDVVTTGAAAAAAVAQEPWENWTEPNPDDERALLRLGMDAEQRVFGVFARLPEVEGKVPAVVVEHQGEIIDTIQMSPFWNGFFAKWAPRLEGRIGNQKVHLLLRVGYGDEEQVLRRRLSLIEGRPGVVAVQSPRQVENWANGEPLAGKAPLDAAVEAALWKNWSEWSSDDKRARLRIGLDTEKRVFGLFARVAPGKGPPPTFQVENSGVVLHAEQMVPFWNGYFAKWTPPLDPRLGREEIHLVLRVGWDGDAGEKLQRRLSLVPGQPGVIGVKARRQIENWPNGEPLASAIEREAEGSPPAVVWENASDPSGEDEKPRLRIGLDAQQRVFGVFARLGDPQGKTPTLVVESGGTILDSAPMIALWNGFFAKWTPALDHRLGDQEINLLLRVQDGSGDEGLLRRLSLQPGRPGVISVTSPRPIENWPNGEPLIGEAPAQPVATSAAWKNWSVWTSDSKEARLRIGLDGEKRVFGVFAKLAAESDDIPVLTIENDGRVLEALPMLRCGGGYLAKWLPAPDPRLGRQEIKLLLSVRNDREGELHQRRLSLVPGRHGVVGVKCARQVENWPSGEPPMARSA